jgi:hypothetical protein
MLDVYEYKDMSDPIEITIDGADKIVKALNDFPDQIKRNFQQAGKESAEELLNTTGLMKYPPESDANKPPTPYYIRGRGTQLARGNNLKSERYGTKFYVKQEGYGVTIGNTASYAKYLADERLQAAHMEKLGWRKLIDVAREKIDKVKAIYNKWAQYTIDKLGL